MDYTFDDENNHLKIINTFLPKPEKEWVDSPICFRCNTTFNYLLPQHHCRACGRCFCSKCCDKIIIPNKYFYAPPEQQTVKNTINTVTSFIYKLSNTPIIQTKTKMVCLNCKERITNLSKISMFIDILEYCDLKTIYVASNANSKLFYASIYYFFKFIKIKNTCIEKLSRWEMNMLLLSANYLDNHNLWKKQYIKLLMMNYYTGLCLHFPLSNNLSQAVTCNILLCDKLCTKKLHDANNQGKYNIFDLIDILLCIMKMENKNTGVRNTIWNNDDIKIKLVSFFDNVYIENIEILITLMPLLVKIIMTFTENLSMQMYTDNVNNKLLIEKILLIVMKTEELTTRFLIEVEKTLTKSTLHNDNSNNKTITKILKIFIKTHKMHNHDEKAKFSRMINILGNIYNFSQYRWQNHLDEIQTELPICYPFDLSFNIVKINKFVNMMGYENLIQFGMVGNRAIEIEISNGTITKQQIIIFKGCMQEEYYNYLIVKMLYNLHNIDCPINNIYPLTDTIYIVEIENNIVPLCSIYKDGLSVRDYIYSNNLSTTLSTILENYSSSLSFLYCIMCLLNIDINNHEQIVLNKNGKIYFSRFSYDKRQFEYPCKILPLTDLFGSKNSNIYKNFIQSTINMYKLLKNYRFIILNILNALLKCIDDIKIDDNIVDIDNFFI
ncbi:zinc finger domain-containing protein [Bodo saltans virus]|uniref:Zinc finger domain-containing protein n=1 Tax=Bodo saltans virus TaxID=2024608 RepID=A0A2H4UW94_9VIRU|nr:zinc finger domain-containing protein [Bodo saltans virus]ATZ81105.1 zinc finger domain-containing protein [Bodo saltans virus]